MSDKYNQAEDKKNYKGTVLCGLLYTKLLSIIKMQRTSSFKEIVAFIHQSWLKYVLWVQL